LIFDIKVPEGYIGGFHAFFVTHVLEYLIQSVLMDGTFNPTDEPLGDVAVMTRQALPYHTVNINAYWLSFHAITFFQTTKIKNNTKTSDDK
jgi:hypothetical protein